MARLLRMPEVAANATEAVLADWAVVEDAEFGASEVIATIETEKAIVDVEADDAGVLLKTLVGPGSSVDVGSPIAVLGVAGEQIEDLDALLAELGVTEGVAPRPAATRRDVEEPAPSPEPVEPPRRIFTSPLARRIAREAGIGLEEIAGTGPHGRILRRDVEAAVTARADRGTVDAAVTARANGGPQTGSSGFTDVPHTRMRSAIAARLTESKQTIPHFSLGATVRVDRLLKLRARLNDGAEVRTSVTDLVVKAVAVAHTLVPEMNVSWGPDAVRRYHSVDVAVAVATDAGLVTPVVRGVDGRSISAVTRETRDLADRARAGRLRQEEIEGGTIAVTNLGMYGVEEFTAIINPPHAAILAVGAARQEPVVRKGRLRPATIAHLTLSVDHRPVDGAIAARWLAELVRLLENPVRILA